MSNKKYELWEVIEGIHNTNFLINIENIIIYDDKKKEIINTVLEDILSCCDENVLPDQKLKLLYQKYFERTKNDISIQTPLSLFLNKPNLFYELFWPEVRLNTMRQYYIIYFLSPIDYKINIIYEVLLTDLKEDLKQLYLCSLGKRISILTSYIEKDITSIMPFEYTINDLIKLFMDQEDTDYILKTLNIKENELNMLIREILTNSLPVYIEFSTEKQKKDESIIRISLTGEGSIILKEASVNNDDICIQEKIRQLLYNYILNNNYEEPEMSLPIHPKSATSPVWIYLYAPKNYEIECTIDNPQYLVNAAPNNPKLASLRVNRPTSIDIVEPFNINVKIKIPSTHKQWLSSLYILLLIFLSLWFLADLSYIKIIPFANRLIIFNSLCESSGFLEVTFTLVSFIFLARTWFFHEEEVYKRSSKRYLIILMLISSLAIINLILNL